MEAVSDYVYLPKHPLQRPRAPPSSTHQRSEIPPTKLGLAQVLLPKPLPRTRDWPAEGQQPHLETPLGRRWDAAGWMGCDTVHDRTRLWLLVVTMSCMASRRLTCWRCFKYNATGVWARQSVVVCPVSVSCALCLVVWCLFKSPCPVKVGEGANPGLARLALSEAPVTRQNQPPLQVHGQPGTEYSCEYRHHHFFLSETQIWPSDPKFGCR